MLYSFLAKEGSWGSGSGKARQPSRLAGELHVLVPSYMNLYVISLDFDCQFADQ